MIMNIRSKVWGILVDLYPRYLRWRYGMDIGKNCRISWKAHLDKSINPKGIHIGDNTWVLSGAMIDRKSTRLNSSHPSSSRMPSSA